MTREEAIAAQLCTRCQRQPVEPGRRACTGCLDGQAAKSAERYQRRKTARREVVVEPADIERWSVGHIDVASWDRWWEMPCFAPKENKPS